MQDVKERVALVSIFISGGLAASKAIIGLLTGSLGLISEAANNIVDLAATILTFFAVKIGGKPADEDHTYGHSKVESVAAFVQAALLLVVAGAIATEAVRRLWSGHTSVEHSWWAIGILVASVGLDLWRMLTLRRVARETRSQALEADAMHFASDMVGSAMVLVGLIIVWLGWKQADTYAALAVSVFLAVIGWRVGRSTLDTLLDAAPKGLVEKLTAVAAAVPGVVSVDRLRMRDAGTQHFIDVLVTVSRSLPLDQVVLIKQEVEQRIEELAPGCEATITADPAQLDDETVMERVLLVARNLALAVHHVTVQEVEGRLVLALDLEVDGAASLEEAHAVATRLENALRGEFGPATEVDTHIEPLALHPMKGEEGSAGLRGEVGAVLAEAALRDGAIVNVHNVRVRVCPEGLVVHFHARVDPAMTVDQAHGRVHGLESALRAARPEIVRVISHVEPRRDPATLPA